LEDKAGYETDLTEVLDVNLDAVGNGEIANAAWLLGDNTHPPEYYLRQLEEDFDKSELTKQGYRPSINVLLDRTKEQWHQ